MWARSQAPVAIYRAPSLSSFGCHLSLSPPSPETFSPRAPSLSAAGSHSIRATHRHPSSSSVAAAAVGFARRRRSLAAGSLVPKSRWKPSSPWTSGLPLSFDLQPPCAVVLAVPGQSCFLLRHRSTKTKPGHPSVVAACHQKVVATVGSTSPPFEARHRRSSVAVYHRVSVGKDRRLTLFLSVFSLFAVALLFASDRRSRVRCSVISRGCLVIAMST